MKLFVYNRTRYCVTTYRVIFVCFMGLKLLYLCIMCFSTEEATKLMTVTLSSNLKRFSKVFHQLKEKPNFPTESV